MKVDTMISDECKWCNTGKGACTCVIACVNAILNNLICLGRKSSESIAPPKRNKMKAFYVQIKGYDGNIVTTTDDEEMAKEWLWRMAQRIITEGMPYTNELVIKIQELK